MFISLVLSFRNEEQNINELVNRCVDVLKKYEKYEIIFVNDASDDNSLELLLNLRKKNKNIKILTTSRPFGVSPCVLAGFKKAKGDAIVYMDSDLQDPPEIIDKLITNIDGCEVVHSVRKKGMEKVF